MSQSQGDAPPHRRLTAPALRRLAALGIDGATYLIIPALLLPLGLLLVQRGVMLSSLVVNALALVLVIAPATAWAAWWETRPRGATVGKRLLRLRVVDEKTRDMPSRRQALVRNLIKITLPWELGHTVALSFASLGSKPVPLWLWALAVITYAWVLANLILLVLPSGKPVHDRLAGTIVLRAHFQGS